MQQNEQEQQMRMKQNEQEHQMQMRKNELEHQRKVQRMQQEMQRMQQEMQRKQQEAEAQNRRVTCSLVLKNNHGAEVRCDGDFQTVTKIMSTTAFSEGANSYLAPPRASSYLDHYVTDVYDDIPDAK